ncbi:MAG: T9SS type A sorting domain-containing protein, partial [Flavobacteriales bacterium]|nr:T9SS type A sorting domain-containing protein [Flavobacteriales bacterium]
NPVTHTLHIKNENPITSISVTNMIGEILLSETPLYNTHSINFDTFPGGIYFVTISATNQTQTLKVVKK